MTDISLDISGKIDEPTVHALAGVKEAADKLGVPFFIIGAKAKEFFLEHVHGLDLRRYTKDLDFGVSLTSWRDLSTLKSDLISGHGFEYTNQVQRIRSGTINIYLVPFGPIAGSDRTLLWPPDESRRMNTEVDILARTLPRAGQRRGGYPRDHGSARIRIWLRSALL